MQITVGVVGCLVIIAGFAIYQYFHRYSAQPQALMAHLQAVSTQSAELTVRDLDPDALIADIRMQIRAELVAQLEQTDIPDPERSADALLGEALEFTEDSDALIDWVALYLQQRVLPQERTELVSTDSAAMKIIQGPEDCLVITRQQGRWALASLFGCDAGDVVGLQNN